MYKIMAHIGRWIVLHDSSVASSKVGRFTLDDPTFRGVRDGVVITELAQREMGEGDRTREVLLISAPSSVTEHLAIESYLHHHLSALFDQLLAASNADETATQRFEIRNVCKQLDNMTREMSLQTAAAVEDVSDVKSSRKLTVGLTWALATLAVVFAVVFLSLGRMTSYVKSMAAAELVGDLKEPADTNRTSRLLEQAARDVLVGTDGRRGWIPMHAGELLSEFLASPAGETTLSDAVTPPLLAEPLRRAFQIKDEAGVTLIDQAIALEAEALAKAVNESIVQHSSTAIAQNSMLIQQAISDHLRQEEGRKLIEKTVGTEQVAIRDTIERWIRSTIETGELVQEAVAELMPANETTQLLQVPRGDDATARHYLLVRGARPGAITVHASSFEHAGSGPLEVRVEVFAPDQIDVPLGTTTLTVRSNQTAQRKIHLHDASWDQDLLLKITVERDGEDFGTKESYLMLSITSTW